MKCSIEECHGKSIAHTYCWKHLQRWYRHGDPLIINKGGRKIIKKCRVCNKKRDPDVKLSFCKECHLKYLRDNSRKFRERYPAKVLKYRLRHEIKQRLEALK